MKFEAKKIQNANLLQYNKEVNHAGIQEQVTQTMFKIQGKTPSHFV